MNRSVWKFPIPIDDHFTIEMPKGATSLSVQTQGETPCLWVLVQPDAPKTKRRFALRGTGHDATGLSSTDFVGTFQLHGGGLVFHLFDLGEET